VVASGGGVFQSVQILDNGLNNRCSIPGGSNDGIIFLQHRFQNGSGAHPISHPKYTGESYSEVKVAGV